MRRTLGGITAFLAFTGGLLVLPVYAAPAPAPEPVETSTEQVEMGSVDAPAPDAEVQEGTTEPVGGVSPVEPTLTVSQTDTAEFSLVGVTWAYDAAVTGTVVQIRVQDEAGAWGDWTAVTVEDSDQNTGTDSGAPRRGGTAPLWTGASHGVEAELVTASGAQPVDVTLDLVDPGTSDADDSLTAPDIQDTADAATAMPDVYSRAQWGADETIRTWDPEYAPTIKAATLHHTADTNNYTADQVPAMMRSIYRYHTVSRGWGDIGYNVIVDKFGRLWEGRYGGLASTVIGAHAGGFNTSTFGVSMLGNYDTTPAPQAMVNAVEAIIAWKFSLYGVNPSGTTVLTSSGGGTSKYAAGQRVTLPTIFGHRDVGSTTCPGQYGYARLPEIRSAVAAQVSASPYVRALYRDMMTRDPDDGGLMMWSTALANGSLDRRGATTGFATSLEYRRLIITQAYVQVLGRGPDPSGMDTWLQQLSLGNVRLDNLRPTLMASAEFYLRGGSSDAAFVNNMYQAALGRSAGSNEVSHWAYVRRQVGPEPVIQAIWGSPEAGMRRVDQAYQYYLGRAAGVSEQQYWLPVVMGSGDERLREEVTVSQEYFLRAQSRFP
ncbi:Uncharacterized conserved protein, contains LGFP repeats [Klenkia marina]|uniref:Uncharacterized conserved protein, contains LGFP repeats n=1 Tax=Klenkia marina TaxID=1960309 RepID=A0A1G4YDY5_9ACTN|nr:DUF4214 domain-containing protein [Klenkia marina]SCX51741.1 Uncharacterized conserved protein, contains LGFP repeats [Klenkia marina]